MIEFCVRARCVSATSSHSRNQTFTLVVRATEPEATESLADFRKGGAMFLRPITPETLAEWQLPLKFSNDGALVWLRNGLLCSNLGSKRANYFGTSNHSNDGLRHPSQKRKALSPHQPFNWLPMFMQSLRVLQHCDCFKPAKGLIGRDSRASWIAPDISPFKACLCPGMQLRRGHFIGLPTYEPAHGRY